MCHIPFGYIYLDARIGWNINVIAICHIIIWFSRSEHTPPPYQNSTSLLVVLIQGNDSLSINHAVEIKSKILRKKIIYHNNLHDFITSFPTPLWYRVRFYISIFLYQVGKLPMKRLLYQCIYLVQKLATNAHMCIHNYCILGKLILQITYGCCYNLYFPWKFIICFAVISYSMAVDTRIIVKPVKCRYIKCLKKAVNRAPFTWVNVCFIKEQVIISMCIRTLLI